MQQAPQAFSAPTWIPQMHMPMMHIFLVNCIRLTSNAHASAQTLASAGVSHGVQGDSSPVLTDIPGA